MPAHLLKLTLASLVIVACIDASDQPALTPAFHRVDLAPDASAEVIFTFLAQPGTVLNAVQVDCACLRNLTQLPAQVGQTGALALTLRASGIRPGVESIIVSTTAGTARAELQIVGPGAGTGLSALKQVLAQAMQTHTSIWGLVHDLRGTIRNCGCSQGSLGGISHLAALPNLAKSLQPGVTARWILTGDSDGQHPGVGAALTKLGWAVSDPAVVVTSDPLAFLAIPGISVVIPTTPTQVNHRRILRPILPDGLVVDLLLVDPAGQVQEHRILPVDATLADNPSILALFPDPLTSKIDTSANPSQACSTCHTSAHGSWLGSRHARALDSLATVDRTDSCISCHTSPVADKTVAPGVSCQSCHLGTTEHMAKAGQMKTTGVTDCRGCHDAKHHPAFDREKAWNLIQHGLEPAGKR